MTTGAPFVRIPWGCPNLIRNGGMLLYICTTVIYVVLLYISNFKFLLLLVINTEIARPIACIIGFIIGVMHVRAYFLIIFYELGTTYSGVLAWLLIRLFKDFTLTNYTSMFWAQHIWDSGK
jgi:hypothetical protein